MLGIREKVQRTSLPNEVVYPFSPLVLLLCRLPHTYSKEEPSRNDALLNRSTPVHISKESKRRSTLSVENAFLHDAHFHDSKKKPN